MRLILRFFVVWVLMFCILNFSVSNTPHKFETVYRIQVASLARRVAVAQIQNQLNINEEITVIYIGGRYKYFIGNFTNRTAATSYLRTIYVPGAYVVALESQDDPVVIQPQAFETTTQQRVVFRVQISASRTQLPAGHFTRSPYYLNEQVDMEFRQGMYKYTVGKYSSFAEADVKRRSLNFSSFVVRLVESIAVQAEEQLIPEVIIPIDTAQRQAYTRAQDDSIRNAARLAELIVRYRAYILIADSLYNANDYENAKKEYQNAVSVQPLETYPRNRITEIDRMSERASVKGWAGRIPFLLYGIITFIVIMIIVLVVIIVLRTRREKQDSKKDELRTEYQDTITEYLFDEEKSGDISKLKGADTKQKKQILIDEIMQLYSNLSGEISNKLRELYFDMELDNESVKKIHSDQWHVQAKGFRELAQMNINVVNEEIENCLNSSNNVLRMEAQLAMIRLNYDNPFGFLDKLQKPFTAWEQLHVYEMAKRHQINIPAFSKWLNSSNETIINFCVKMIRAFKQDDAYEQVTPLIKHANKEIRKESIITLGELRNDQILPLLKEMYNLEDLETQMVILGAMGNMPRESNIEFLRTILEPDNQLRKEAAEALSNIEEFGTRGLENILVKSEEDLQAIAKHILDKRI